MRVRRSCESSMLVRCTFPYFLLGTPPGYDRENPRNPRKITQYMILMEKKNKVSVPPKKYWNQHTSSKLPKIKYRESWMNPVWWGELKEERTPYRQKNRNNNYKKLLITVKASKRKLGWITIQLLSTLCGKHFYDVSK